MSEKSKIKKKIIVTGGAGLIGSYLTELLSQKNNEVTVIDDFSTGEIKHLSKIKNKIKILEGNLESLEFCFNSFKDCDEVYHLASRAYGIGYSRKNNLELLIHNEKITNNLIEVFTNFQPNKILISSSSCIYDENGTLLPETTDLFDGSPELANLGYGWAKRFLEKKFELLSKETGIQLYIARPFNIYGERYKWRGSSSQAIPMIIKKVLDREDPLIIWGSGKQKRSYVHASDCARLMEKLMDSNLKNPTINIGGYSSISIKELVKLIMKITKFDNEVVFDKSQPEGSLYKISKSDQLSSVFPDFKFQVSLDDGIKKMIDWYFSNFNKVN